MTELSEREDIIITKADKGGEVVIVDVKDYIKEAEWGSYCRCKRLYKRSWMTTTQQRKLQKTSRRPDSNKHEISKWYDKKMQKTKTNKWKSSTGPE